MRTHSTLFAISAIAVIILSLWQLEQARSGIEIQRMTIGSTPATLYRQPEGTGPLVVVAHGFAGSQPLMQAYSLTLARAGFQVLAFDFLGHGRNPLPMSGDVTAVDGTTTLLVEETRRVIAAGRDLPGVEQGVALLGHSMASDVIVRAAIAEREAGTAIAAVVAISMFSPAVSATEPARLLAVSGEWEASLRDAALDSVRLVDPSAGEGETVRGGKVVRRAAVAPHVEHVSVLYSAVALDETRQWLNDSFGRSDQTSNVNIGPWILLLLVAIVALLRPLVDRLPVAPTPTWTMTRPRFLIATILPAAFVPLIATALPTRFLPVLVADYLAVHLALYGLVQLLLIAFARRASGLSTVSWPRAPVAVVLAAVLLGVWGIGVFGLAMDRYAASFLPIQTRLPIIASLCVGTLPFMLADSVLSGAGRGRWWRRLLPRLTFILSLGLATLLRPADLGFLLILLPVLLLFFLVHGTMGRWIAQRSGPLAAGLGLGLILAWAIGVTFPLFAATE